MSGLPATDPEQEAQNTDLQAYGWATKNDPSALEQLHKDITARQARITARMNNPAAGGGHLFPGSQPGLDQTAAGFGHGLSKVGDFLNKVGSAATGTPADTPLTDDKEDKPLLSTSHGAVGDIAANVAATAPVGVVGAAARSALPATLRGLPGLAAKAGIGAAENATGAAIGGGDPSSAAKLGGTLSAGGGVLGRTMRGLVGKTPAAERLMQDAAEEGKDITIPISQGGTGVGKQLYQKMLPYALGVETRLKNQSNKAKDILTNEVAPQNVMPAQVDEAGKLNKTNAPVGETTEQTAADIKATYEKLKNDTVNSYRFKPDEDFQANVLGHLSDTGLPMVHQKQVAGTLHSILQDHLDEDGTISGANLLRARSQASKAMESLPASVRGTTIDPAKAAKGVNAFNDIIDDTIAEHKEMGGKIAPGVARDLENFRRIDQMEPQAKAFTTVSEANPADRGAVSGGKLATESPPGTPIHSMGQDIHEVLEKEPAGSVNPAGRHVVSILSALGAGHGNMLGPTFIGGAHFLTNPSTQRALYGDTAAQQAISRLLRENPNAAHLAGYVGRQGAVDYATGQ